MAMLYHNPGPGVAYIGGVLILPGEARDVDADRMPAPVSALASDIAGDPDDEVSTDQMEPPIVWISTDIDGDPDDKGDTGAQTESGDETVSPEDEPASVKRRRTTAL